MSIIAFFINFLSEEKLSVNHLFVSFFIFQALYAGDYLYAAFFYVAGVLFCGMMDRIRKMVNQ